jgi:hypothetical protein
MRVGRAAAGGSDAEIHGAVMLLWASEHLDNLAHLEERLVPPAAAAAEVRRRWWARDVATHSQ